MKKNSKNLLKKQSLKKYVRGFLKGFLVLLAYYVVLMIYVQVLSKINNISIQEAAFLDDTLFQVTRWISGFAIVGFIVGKYKLMRGWLLIGLIFSIFTVPFIMGDAELRKK